jgi:hypothetical protein
VRVMPVLETELWKILFAAEVDETNEAVENAEWVWTPQNTL